MNCLLYCLLHCLLYCLLHCLLYCLLYCLLELVAFRPSGFPTGGGAKGPCRSYRQVIWKHTGPSTRGCFEKAHVVFTAKSFRHTGPSTRGCFEKTHVVFTAKSFGNTPGLTTRLSGAEHAQECCACIRDLLCIHKRFLLLGLVCFQMTWL